MQNHTTCGTDEASTQCDECNDTSLYVRLPPFIQHDIKTKYLYHSRGIIGNTHIQRDTHKHACVNGASPALLTTIFLLQLEQQTNTVHLTKYSLLRVHGC